jgi:glycosyltransferase involved in cell wall biosynthesis
MTLLAFPASLDAAPAGDARSGLRLLDIQIANGYSAEARVLASVLGPRDPIDDVLALYHVWPGGPGAEAFARAAQARVDVLDTGWRPNPRGRRSMLGRAYSRLRFRTTLPSMLRTARAYRPDVIMSSQQQWDCAAATYLACRTGRPQIMYLHYLIGPWLTQGVIDRLTTCDHVLAVSGFIREHAIAHGVRPDRVTTVTPSLAAMHLEPRAEAGAREAVRCDLGIPLDAQVIGIVGRLDPYKGQRDTILAFARVAASHPSARLIVTGDAVSTGGTPRAELEALAHDSGLLGRVHFSGNREDVPRILASLDIFMHPSRNEPFGLALAEAALAGLPIIAYAEGGVFETVVDGQTGMLARPADVAHLAANLDALLSDPARARRMGAAGRERALSKFEPRRASKRFIDTVRAVADAHAQSAA